MPSLNPLLSSIKLPGRVFQLPSKGLFYAPGVLASTVVNAEIQVKPMSALTELKIKSADLLISGKVLREVCVECAPEILNPEKLLSRDVDGLFCFLVAATYGDVKKIHSGHDCKGAQWRDHQVNLQTIIANPNNESLNHVDTLFSVKLSNGQTVRLKPVTYEDSLTMMNLKQSVAKADGAGEIFPLKLLEEIVVADLMSVIDWVEDTQGGEVIKVTNKAQIEEWIRAIPKRFVDEITVGVNRSADWGFTFSVPIECPDCGSTYPYALDLNPINFFSG